MNKKMARDEALPKGWREVRLENVGEIVTGITPSTKVREYYENGVYPFITPTDINSHKNISASERFLSIKGLEKGRLIPKRSLLVTCIASIGKNAILDREGSCNQQINAILPFEHYNVDYLYYLIESNSKYLSNQAGSSVTPILNKSAFSKLTFIIPPLPEQKAIASLLEIWDTAIEKTETLIVAKEKRFKWLLKRLISDQQDNPEWRKVTLGEIGIVSSAGVDKKTIESEITVKLVNYLDVLRKNFIFSDDLDHWVTAQERKTIQCDVRKGDVFFTPSSEIQGDIAHSAVALEDIEKGVYSYHVVRFRLKENWDLLFRGYAFKSSHFYHQAYRLCEGSGQRYVISQNYFRNMTISAPGMREQSRIAQTLDAVQKEINLLQELTEQYRTQKRGLMQKLLTGKWKIRK